MYCFGSLLPLFFLAFVRKTANASALAFKTPLFPKKTAKNGILSLVQSFNPCYYNNMKKYVNTAFEGSPMTRHNMNSNSLLCIEENKKIYPFSHTTTFRE